MHSAPARRIAIAIALAVAHGSAGTLRAQTLDQLRDSLRDAASHARQVAFLAGMVDLSDTGELAAGSLRVHGDPHFDVTTLKLPFRRDLPDVFGDDVALHLEAGIGWFAGRAAVADVFDGTLPGSETAAKLRYDALSGYLGFGPRLALAEDLTLTPLADASLAYLTNDTDYGGPGAAATAAVADGILFNWNAVSIAYGGALLLEHDLDLDLDLDRHLRSLLRYDWRAFDVVRSTDRAQDETATVERLVARSEFSAPTGLAPWQRPLDWNMHAAYIRYLGGDRNVLGFVDYFEFGVGLAAPLRLEPLPFDGVTLSLAAIVGEDVRGWSAGVSVTF